MQVPHELDLDHWQCHMGTTQVMATWREPAPSLHHGIDPWDTLVDLIRKEAGMDESLEVPVVCRPCTTHRLSSPKITVLHLRPLRLQSSRILEREKRMMSGD
jgi:hypothetical protein